MSMTRLRALDAVVRAGGVSAGARALGVRQPTVSAQLAALERQYGVHLVDRATGAPSQLGARLSEITGAIFALEREAVTLLEQGDAPTRLRLGADAPVNVMPLLALARRRTPDLQVEIRTGNSAEVLRWLRAGTVDLGVAAEVDTATLAHLRLREQQLVAVVRTDHPAARGKTLTLAALAREPVIMRETGSASRRALERAAERAGLALRTITTVHGREAALAAVAAGLGTAVIPEDEMLEDPRLVMLDLRRPAIAVTEYLLWRRGEERTPVVRDAIQDARPTTPASARRG